MNARVRSTVCGTTLVLASACATPQGSTARTGGGVEFTHYNSIVDHWPFGLDEITTKIVAEPLKAENSVESYWAVRLAHAGALQVDLRVSPEFSEPHLAPVRGVDYELMLGEDRNGARSTDLAGGLVRIDVPRLDLEGQTGFALRARFLGDSDGPEPPKSLLVEIVRVLDVESGHELPLGARFRARWLIVDPESGR